MKQIFTLFLAVLTTSTVVFAQTEPTNQPTDLLFTNVLAYKLNLSYQGASDADGYILLRSTSPINDIPVDGTTYLKGAWIGDAKVFYVGSASNVTLGIKEVVANTTYHFAIFSYNDGASIDYLQANPLVGEVTTPDGDFGSYYNNIDFTSNAMIDQLTNLINPHIMIPYSQYDENIVANFYEKDTVINGVASKTIRCQYSNEIRTYEGVFVYVDPQPTYTREHRMAFSWINFEGITRDEFEERPEGNDIHALELVQGDVNSSRSNYSFGEIDGNPWANSYLDFTIGTDVDGTVVANPRPDRHGDIARALYYMMVCYNGKYGENWGMDNLLERADQQDLAVLKTWHEQDPVDDYEIARHEFVASIQNNRNPFIDFPELVDCIDFSNLTKKSACDVDTTLRVIDLNGYQQLQVYPNPATDRVYFNNDGLNNQLVEVIVYNAIGEETLRYFGDVTYGLSVKDLAQGYYTIKTSTADQVYVSNLLIGVN